MLRRGLALLVLLAGVHWIAADGPMDNLPDKVRPVPGPGIPVPETVKSELQKGVDDLGKEIADLRKSLEKKQNLLRLLPDVQIFHNSVRYALTYNEFYAEKDFAAARNQLQLGRERARLLREGKAPWTTATGQVVRGYVSKIDGSVQPYGLVVPASYQANTPVKFRLDLWCHGRGEKLSEVAFLDDRQKSPGQFTPPNAIVLHLYGRYCCANKLAGEIDAFEAMENVKANYPIDENRVVIRGFSMGGAACWQFAVHYPGVWAAAAPGAGFSETPEFLKVFQNEVVQPTWYERKLWGLYDCPGYCVNLYNLPTVAYSGEIDRQKQAADIMAAALQKEGLELTHLIGPKTGHSYHPETKAELNRRIDQIVALGRNPVPERVRFATFTLRYPRSFWVNVDGLEHHWSQGRVDAQLTPRGIEVKTKGITGLTLQFGPGEYPLATTKVVLDGSPLQGGPLQSDGSWSASFHKAGGPWTAGKNTEGLAKRPGLQGPIDDAFLDSFVMVRPSGKPLSEKVGTWTEKEMQHATDHWRKQFRGEARIKTDEAITDADIAEHNLILWGDPQSNKILARIADKLPIRWNAQEIVVGERRFAADHHVPLLIYPNPLNPRRYVVLNSGFTFREYDYLNNARQIPKLPDYAIVDTRSPVTSRLPGAIPLAGFFGEAWELLPNHGEK